MRDLLDQIEKAIQYNLYYVALYTSLSIPDICGALESTNGLSTGAKYKKWFDNNVALKYSGILNGDDCWRFRCSLLHKGTTQHPHSGFSRVLFIEPKTTTAVTHNIVMNGALNIDVRIFCIDIIDSCKSWLNIHQTSALFQTNYNKFMRRYPNGLSPYIKGVPVIS